MGLNLDHFRRDIRSVTSSESKDATLNNVVHRTEFDWRTKSALDAAVPLKRTETVSGILTLWIHTEDFRRRRIRQNSSGLACSGQVRKFQF